jgi:hypothetical protein
VGDHRPELRVTVSANGQSVELIDNAAALVLLAVEHAEELNSMDMFKAIAHVAHGKAHLETSHSYSPIRYRVRRRDQATS